MILALLASLGAIVTAFVLYPVFTTQTSGAGALDDAALALSDLHDRKARLLASIQDLDFEKDSGKVSDTDYDAARNDYVAQVASVIEEIDALAPKKAKSKSKSTPADVETPEPDAARTCESCGAENPADSKFCLGCGDAFERACASCGEALPAKARFCNQCGAKVDS